MCDPVTIGTTIASIAVSQMMAPKAPKMPSAPAPVAPPQAAKMPEQQAVRKSQAAAGGGGPAGGGAAQGTLLTGAGGVTPGALNLGRSTLLGQ